MKVIKGLLWVVVLIILIVLIGWATKSSKNLSNTGSGDTIKIGFIGALTGDGAEYGEPQRNAIQIAADEINKNGGIDGKPVEVIYEDGKCTGEGGANAAQKLVNIDKVKVVLGGSCSGETLSAIPVVESGKVFMISGSASSPALTNKSQFFSRDYPSDNAQGNVLAEEANKRGWKKVAIINEQTDYASGIPKAFSDRFTELGGVEVREEFPTKQTDFRAQIAKLKASGAEALLISTQTTASAGRVLTQLQQSGWKPALMLNDVIGSNLDFTAQYKNVLEGAMYADFFIDPNNEKFKTFNDEYKSRYGKEIAYPGYTVSVYDSLYIVKDAIEKVGYDGEKVAKWVRELSNWQGASGTITIGSDGDRDGGHVLKVIKDGKGGVVQ